MQRRDFVITSGSAIFSTSILGGMQKPVFGLEFELSTIPDRKPDNIDSVLIDFTEFQLIPQYINFSKDVTVEIQVEIDGYSTKKLKQISIKKGQKIKKKI